MKNASNVYVLTIAFMLGFAFLRIPLAAEEWSAADAKALPAGINKVVSGGYWARDGEEGFFRAVIVADGIEHVAQHLYLQWLRIDHSTQGYRVVSTVPVKEVNSAHGAVFDAVVGFTDGRKMKLDISIKPRSGGAAKEITVIANADGTYAVVGL